MSQLIPQPLRQLLHRHMHRSAPCLCSLLLVLLLGSGWAAAAECYALVVAGDPGRPVAKPENTYGDWSTQFSRWRIGWEQMLTGTYHVPKDHVQVLRSVDPNNPNDAGSQVPDAELATREHILAALAGIALQSTPADQVILILIGHGYHSQASARFCLNSTDLSDADLEQALSTLKCRQLVCLILAPDCMAMVHTLSAPGRVLVIANVKTSAPYFSEFLLHALAPGGVSLLQAFNQASLDTIHWYQNQEYMADKKAWLVHGKRNQDLWRLFYPRGPMFAGDDVPHVIVNTNDPDKIKDIVGRRLIAEVAGLDDNGDGNPSTIYEAGPDPAPLPGTAGNDGELSATLILGKP